MKTCVLPLLFLATVVILGSSDTFAQVHWIKYAGNPVLSGGEYGSWNRQLNMPCVLYNADSTRFEMWFAASAYPYGPVFPYKIGFAFSEDGRSWTMHPTPVLGPTPGAWDSANVDMPWVIRKNGAYKMWYTGSIEDRKTGYATSPDGVNWTKHQGNPVFEARPNSWEAGLVHCGFVMAVQGGYQMYYSAGVQYVYTKEEIAYATSADGIVWERDTVKNPILPAGPEGTWDDTWVFAPRILYLDRQYYMWYGGTGEYWGIYCLGLATSSDGIAWERYGGNPVLVPSPGTWDGYKTLSGSVLLVGDSLYMWYDAAGATGTNQLWCIGLATCRFVPVSVTQDVLQPTEFSLLQNYPNPFNPGTTIKYELPKSSVVRLSVYDMLGREVSVLVNERRDAGVHEVWFDATGLSSGMYFYRLQTGDFVQTRKLVVLK